MSFFLCGLAVDIKMMLQYIHFVLNLIQTLEKVRLSTENIPLLITSLIAECCGNGELYIV